MPVVVSDDPGQMEGLTQALLHGGLGTVEITLRTDGAIDAIGVAANLGDLIVGAGTVLDIEQAKSAVGAGAQFLVSPGFDPAVTDWAVRNNIPMIPGIATVTEAMLAVKSGLNFVKLFPAAQLGGAAFARAIGAVLPDLKTMPTGGVSQENLSDYFAIPSVGAVGGTWLAPAQDIASGDFRAITARVVDAVKCAKSIS